MATSATDPGKLRREVLGQDQGMASEKKEEEKREFGRCLICCKDNDHLSYACPYWYEGVPEGATVGPGYGVVYDCDDFNDHPGRQGRLIIARCAYCKLIGVHWTQNCPERPKDKPYIPHSQLTKLVRQA